jgi:uncharacterized protein (DUF2252 family)
MAADLATVGHSGIIVQHCGDAHLSNFGGFASPERDFLFDINDFDETLPGPFEWDVKRLAASLEVASRSRGFDSASARTIVSGGVRTYREAIRAFAGLSNLAVWYARLDVAEGMERWGAAVGKNALEQVERNAARAQTKDQMKARAKLTRLVDGDLRFVSDPPLLVPVHELLGEMTARALRTWSTLSPGDRSRLRRASKVG